MRPLGGRGSGGLESGDEAQSKHVLFGFVSMMGQASTVYPPPPLHMYTPNPPQ